MPWVRLDEHFTFHRKVRPLSDAAFRLHVSALCWSAQNLLDGKLADSELTLVSDVKKPQRAAEELVARGVWEKTQDGWLIHDYHDYQPTAAKVRATREMRRQAGQIGGLASGSKRKHGKNEPDYEAPWPADDPASDREPTSQAEPKQSASHVLEAKSNPVPTRPVPNKRPAPTVLAAGTINDRANALAKVYTDLVPMSKFVAIKSIAKKAIDSGYQDQAIADSLVRLAESRRTVTIETLRIELDGPPLPTQRPPSSVVVLAEGLERTARYRAQEQAALEASS